MKHDAFTILLGTLGLTFTLCLFLNIWMSFPESFRVTFGSFYVLFLPGFIGTYALFFRTPLEVIERLILAVIFSIMLVPLLVYYANRFGLPLNSFMVFLVTSVICLLSLSIIGTRYWTSSKKPL